MKCQYVDPCKNGCRNKATTKVMTIKLIGSVCEKHARLLLKNKNNLFDELKRTK